MRDEAYADARALMVPLLAATVIERTRGRNTIFAMVHGTIRAGTPDDLQALTDIYNYYVLNTTVTFELHPLTAEERRAWFNDHHLVGAHRLLVAEDHAGLCVGYATSSRWRPKAAYNTTVEASVYWRPDAVWKGYGTALYIALFASLERQDVQTIVARVSLPNPRDRASRAVRISTGWRILCCWPEV
jgi:phosphinothricin acetyltransferase